MVEYASRSAIEAAMAEWKPTVLLCRLYGHDPVGYQAARQRNGDLLVTERCRHRCGLRWTYLMDRNGYSYDRRPHYPKDYLLKGVGRMGPDGKAVIRLSVLSDVPIVEEGA